MFSALDNNELQLRKFCESSSRPLSNIKRSFLSLRSLRVILNEINRKLIVRVRFCEMEFFTVINGVKRDGLDSRWF